MHTDPKKRLIKLNEDEEESTGYWMVNCGVTMEQMAKMMVSSEKVALEMLLLAEGCPHPLPHMLLLCSVGRRALRRGGALGALSVWGERKMKMFLNLVRKIILIL
jgi:hypothetical protein